MRRRDFIATIAGMAAVPLAARAQQSAKMKRIAVVSAATPAANMFASKNQLYRAFFDEMSRLGFVEGKNLFVERYSAEGQPNRFAQLARDVVDTHPDAVFAGEATLGLAFKAATTTVPIVTLSADPVVSGLVSNIARPGGNITGTSIDAGLEIWGKRIGLLKETLPKLSNVRILMQTRDRWESPYGSAIRQAAKAAKIAVTAVWFDGTINAAEYERVFAAFEQDRPDALMVGEYTVHLVNAVTIVELAAKHRLPALYTVKDFVEIGGLIAYSPDREELGRSTGYQMGQILNGTNPGDIPYNLVSHYELALNLKTAKSFGIEFPATLLGSADFVVE
jgi:putative tryptophan/tyrosine transport system substrate-binding protein